MKTPLIFILIIAVLLAGCAPTVMVQPTQAAAAQPTQAEAAPTQPETPAQPEQGAVPTPAPSIVQFPADGPTVRLTYDATITGSASIGMVDAVAPTADQPFFAEHPAFVQIAFPDYYTGQAYQLPFGINTPQIMVFRTQDFGGYGDDAAHSYLGQLDELRQLLDSGVDANDCTQTASGGEYQAPFLPLINSAQVFCAKPQIITFAGGRGVRYITYYSQGIAPLADFNTFYTFQGLSDDGQYYISAQIPVRTNLLPSEEPEMALNPDLEAMAITRHDQIADINAQPDDRFTYTLVTLDTLIAGLEILGD